MPASRSDEEREGGEEQGREGTGGGRGQAQGPGVSFGTGLPWGVPGRVGWGSVSTLTCRPALLDTLPAVGDALSQVTRAQDVALIA